MAKLTVIQSKLYKSRLAKLKSKLPELESALKSARMLGDLSENSEYDAAKSNLSQTRYEIDNLETLLRGEIVPYDQSQTLVEGSLIEVYSPSLVSNEYPDGKVVLLLSGSGDFITEPVLNTNSGLGKLVLGNLSGEFKYKDTVYYVTKIKNPDLDSFCANYLDEDLAIKKLFEEVDL